MVKLLICHFLFPLSLLAIALLVMKFMADLITFPDVKS